MHMVRGSNDIIVYSRDPRSEDHDLHSMKQKKSSKWYLIKDFEAH